MNKALTAEDRAIVKSVIATLDELEAEAGRLPEIDTWARRRAGHAAKAIDATSYGTEAGELTSSVAELLSRLPNLAEKMNRNEQTLAELSEALQVVKSNPHPTPRREPWRRVERSAPGIANEIAAFDFGTIAKIDGRDAATDALANILRGLDTSSEWEGR